MYEELLKKAQELWPKRSDLNPRTMREDALIRIFCQLIDAAFYAKRFTEGPELELVESRVDRALEITEDYIRKGYDFDEDADRVILQVQIILKGRV